MAKIDQFFRMMAEHCASDLHLISGQPPALGIHGELERITGQAVLTTEMLYDMLFEIAPGLRHQGLGEASPRRRLLPPFPCVW